MKQQLARDKRLKIHLTIQWPKKKAGYVKRSKLTFTQKIDSYQLPN